MVFKYQVCGFICNKVVEGIIEQREMKVVHILSEIDWVYLFILTKLRKNKLSQPKCKKH